MKVSLLSGAYKNAGDFLIVQRCKELLKYLYDDIEIKEYKRDKKLDENIHEINKSDVLIIAGGPAYVKNLYPNKIPLVDDLDSIKIPIFAMAMGWKGKNDNQKTVYSYSFDELTIKLLKRIEHDGFSLGCRDIYTQRVLNNVGIKNTIMTGCAAWYDIKNINNLSLNDNNISKICISDPADPKYYNQFLDVIKFMKKRYSNANIRVIFHRGITSDNFTSKKDEKKIQYICSEINKMGIKYLDIAYDYKGMSIYDTCDLHIGYRVHAHIYNLSKRNKTILIEEDGRGAGVNHSLGLLGIKAYALKFNNDSFFYKISNKFFLEHNVSKYVVPEINDYINELENNNFKQLEWAFERMNYYFDNMLKHLKQLNKLQKNK